MTNYAVLVYEDLATGMLVVHTIRDDDTYYFDCKREAILRMDNAPNYKLVDCVAGTNKEEFMKASVKAKVDELISYCKYYKDYFDKTDFSSEEVKKEAFESYLAGESLLMKFIGSKVKRCLDNGIEVDSELALACYDYRQKEMLKIA